jgi:hypothetical protein
MLRLSANDRFNLTPFESPTVRNGPDTSMRPHHT